MIKISFFLSLIILNCTITFGQNVSQKSSKTGALPWVKGVFPQNSLSIKYKVVIGDGDQLEIAQNQALHNLVFELGIEKGVTISSKTISEIKEKTKQKNNELSKNFSNKVTIVQGGFSATFSKIDEYYEKIKESDGKIIYRTWHLYAIGNDSDKVPEIKYTLNYGFDAGWRSAIVPGWGQFYKKSTGKGILFLGLGAASTASVIHFQNRYNYNMTRSEETPILELKKEYESRADDNLAYRNIAIGAVAATWVWSFIDAMASDGAPKYDANKNKLKLDFVSTNESNLAINLKYRF